MASMEFVVHVYRSAADVQQSDGSSNNLVLRIELMDLHVGAARTTFDELKLRFPASEGFRLELLQRNYVSKLVDSQTTI